MRQHIFLCAYRFTNFTQHFFVCETQHPLSFARREKIDWLIQLAICMAKIIRFNFIYKKHNPLKMTYSCLSHVVMSWKKLQRFGICLPQTCIYRNKLQWTNKKEVSEICVSEKHVRSLVLATNLHASRALPTAGHIMLKFRCASQQSRTAISPETPAEHNTSQRMSWGVSPLNRGCKRLVTTSILFYIFFRIANPNQNLYLPLWPGG